jgi:hypothetical protein
MWTYDAAGNIKQVDVNGRKFTYDPENRQATACINCDPPINNLLVTYAYDGNGLRVSKTVGSQTTYYVYDAGGNLAAEYGSVPDSRCGTCSITQFWRVRHC